MAESPTILVIGGPNEAGKTTLTPVVMKRYPQITNFLNADSIARGISGRINNSAAYLAGRIMIKRMEVLASQNISFGIESTLSGKTLAVSLQRYKLQGYRVEVIYISRWSLRNLASIVWLSELTWADTASLWLTYKGDFSSRIEIFGQATVASPIFGSCMTIRSPMLLISKWRMGRTMMA